MKCQVLLSLKHNEKVFINVVLLSLKNNEKVFINVPCCSRDLCLRVNNPNTLEPKNYWG